MTPKSDYVSTSFNFLATRAKAAPVLDGIASSGEWDSAASFNFSPAICGFWDNVLDNGDANGRAKIMYDEVYLYILTIIQDGKLYWDTVSEDNGANWLDDSIEFYFDGDFSKSSPAKNQTQYATGGLISVTANGKINRLESGFTSWGNDAQSAGWLVINNSTQQLGSYGNLTCEMRIRLDKIGSPTPGEKIGFNIAYNDDDTGGEIRQGSMAFSGINDNFVNDEAQWGILTFECIVCDRGDVNCDNSLTPGDALLAFRIYLKSYIPIGDEPCDVLCSADFNKDGAITPGDALCIFKEYLMSPC